MYNPYDNSSNNNHNTNDDRTGKENSAGYGTAETPSYTTQASQNTPQGQHIGGMGVPVGSPYTRQDGTASSPSYPTSNSQQTYQTGAGSSVPGVPQSQQARPSYTWNTNGGAPQQTAPYYVPEPPKKKAKGHGGKVFAKILAGVLCCAVVSLSSVGVFALMIQNGVINVESTGDSKTAAFTLYKLEDGNKASNMAVNGEALTPQQVAEKLIPSVVCIQNYRISQQQGLFLGGYQNDESGSVSPAGEGSGIIISKDGYIVTNQHVVDGATSLKVITSDGMTYEATLIGEDTQTDLAVIKIETEDELTPADFGTSEDLKVADEVMAIGNPGGLQLNSSVTMGYISALNRQVTNSDTGYTINCIQTDAAINPGNSGGALVDMNGHVVGINSSKIVATGYEGLGFAIPSDTVQPIVSDLIEYGYVKDRTMLGITGAYVDRMSASFYGLTQGFVVEKATSEEAQKAGLEMYDVITAIDDTQVTSASTISSYIANKKPGETVTLTVVRASSGKSEQVKLVLSENSGESN